MMMIIELQNATKDFGAICDELNELGNEIGVTEIRLLTIGIPYFFSISSPVLTKSFATVVILLYIFFIKHQYHDPYNLINWSL